MIKKFFYWKTYARSKIITVNISLFKNEFDHDIIQVINHDFFFDCLTDYNSILL